MAKEKEKLNKEINDVLGLKVDFTKLTVEDLKALHELVTNPGKMLSVLGKAAKTKWGRTTIGDAIKFLSGEEGDKGPLGLGLLPGIRGKIRRDSSD